MASNFFLAPVAVLELPGLTHTDKAVWTALCSFAQWDDDVTRATCHPSLLGLQRRSGCCRNTVLKCLNNLENMGLVAKTSGNATMRNRYALKVQPMNRFTLCTSSANEPVHPVTSSGSSGDKTSASSEPKHTNNTPTNTPIENEPEIPSELSSSESVSGSHGQRQEPKPKPKPKAKDGGGAGKSSTNSDNSKAKKHHAATLKAAFEEFWGYYPNKDGEAAARKAFCKLFPFNRKVETNNATLQRVQARLTILLEKVEGKDQRYIQQAKNWLRDEDFGHD